MIFKAPEPKSDLQHENEAEQKKLQNEDRKKQDQKLIDDLLEAIVPHRKIEEMKFNRIGTYNPDKHGSRPLKVRFDSKQIQKEVMENARRLQNADGHLKGLSLCYDMTDTERNHAKDLTKEAKEKTKNFPGYIFKVRGPPGKMEIVRYQKKER